MNTFDLERKRPPIPPPRAATRVAAGVWAAAGLAWVIGFISNFLAAPTNTGLDVAHSYAAFQTGSNVGNVAALLLWTGATVGIGWYLSRSHGPVLARVSTAFGLTAVLSLYPAGAVSSAVGHVVPIEDGFVYHDWLARPLLAMGAFTLAIAIAVVLVARTRRP